MFIEIATCLWAFSFANVEGQTLDAGAFRDEGILVYVSLEPLTNVCISEIVRRRPMPFQVDIRPRFPEALALVSQECELRDR